MKWGDLYKADCDDVNLSNKLGEVLVDELMSDNTSSSYMGLSIMRALLACKTEQEFEIADRMLTAVCGWGIDTLMEKIKKRDENNYVWESFEQEELD